MCEFISWIEVDDLYSKGTKLFYLTNSDLDTKEGRKLLKSDFINDIDGHGAIRHYYPELKSIGLNRECENFSTQKNFPPEIATAFKNGKLSMIGYKTNVLTKEVRKKFNKFEAACQKEYETKLEAFDEEMSEKRNEALTTYNRRLETYDKRHSRKTKKDRNLRSKYEVKQDSIYEKVCDRCDNLYQKFEEQESLDLSMAIASHFSSIIRIQSNRNRYWQ